MSDFDYQQALPSLKEERFLRSAHGNTLPCSRKELRGDSFIARNAVAFPGIESEHSASWLTLLAEQPTGGELD
jgi:hypothetical protein